MTVKTSRAAFNQYFSAPDHDSFTLPAGDFTIGFILGMDGVVSGEPQYLISNGGFGAAGSFNITYEPANGKLKIWSGTNTDTSNPTLAGTVALAAGEIWAYFVERAGSVLSLQRFPILANAPADGSAMQTDTTAALNTALSFNSTAGMYIGSRSDKNTARMSDQSLGRVFAMAGLLTPLEKARLAFGEDVIAQLGKTVNWYVRLDTVDDFADRGPSANVFTKSGTPTTSTVQPAFGYGAAPSTNSVTLAGPAAERIYQRINGAASIAVSGAYAGTTPTAIEYQLYAEDDVTVVKPWTAMSATIASGAWSATPAIPAGGMYKMAVRSKSGTTVLATSAIFANVFGVGDLFVWTGSSTPEGCFTTLSGSGFTARADVRVYAGSWAKYTGVGSAILAANALAEQSGVPIGFLHCGIGGTTLAGDWLNTSSTAWTRVTNYVTANGLKLAGAVVSVGSNDAANQLVVDTAGHLANLQELFLRIRNLTGQAALPIMIGGYNRRTSYGGTYADFARRSDAVRMAENASGDLAGVSHVQVVDFPLSSDGIHMLPAGFQGLTNRIGKVWARRLYGDGVYMRGPVATAFTFSGSDVFIDVAHRNGTDLSPATGGTGFTVSDSSGTPSITATARVSATRYRVTCNRALVAPVVTRVLAGPAPADSAPIMDDGTMPLPMHVETVLATTAVSTADTTAPVMTGEITVSAITTSGATLSCPAATDAVGVAGYEYSINGGTNYTVIANAARSVAVSGRPASTAHAVRMRAFDAAGNRATPLSASFTTLAEQPAQNAVVASTVAESRRVAFPGGTRVVAFGSVPGARTPNAPYLEVGKWWSEKHPLDERYWVADITIDLAERGTTAVKVDAIVAGVTVLQQPVIQGKLIPVKLGGFNAATGAVNFCTFRVTCANGERFDRTIWFKQQVGSWSLEKDADDESYFVADISNDLADSNTSASAVLAQPVGVSVLVPAVIQGSLILVKLGGMDTLPAGVNYCDLRIDCANSERFYRTIQFNRVDN
jgi:hypothetical protein